jgi:hypothetical protein
MDPMAASVADGTTGQPRWRPGADAAPLPGRLALASEAFSGAIDYLMPRARADYLDIAQHELTPLVNGFYLGDPAADDLVAAIRASHGGARAQFDKALEHGIDTVPDPLPEVSAFLATVDEVPDWIDEELVEVGVRALRRIDAITFLGAGWVLGFLLAAIVPNSSRSMASNARAVRNAGQRFAETGRITLDMFDRGGRGRFGAGTRSSSRLRVLHAAVRAQLRRRGDWDESVYGVPISATDVLMAALMPGASALAAKRAGYRFSPRELAGIAHFNGLFAYRQGSPAALIPSTFDGQTKALYFALRGARGQVDSESTDRLMPALVNIEIPGLPGVAQRAVRAVFNGYARRIFGPQLCAATGIPDTPVRHLIPLGSVLIRPFEVMRCQLRVVDLAAHSGADLMWRRLMPLVLSDRADYGWSHIDKIVKH